jgi:hypothetical protein
MLGRSRRGWMLCLVVCGIALGGLARCPSAWADQKLGKSARTTEVARPWQPSGDEWAATPEGDTPFLRVIRDEADVPQSLETAVVRYVPANGDHPGLTVDLIGAVHIGEGSYYQELNTLFDDYDVVLYELVAEKDARPGDRQDASPIAMLQQGITTLLEMEFQLTEIDYDRDNFVHADMSPEQFAQSMQDRGEDFMSILSRMMAQGMAGQGGQQELTLEDLMAAMFDENRGLAMKRVLAGQFENMDTMMAAFEGPGGSTIIGERNKVALQELRRQIERGQLRIGVFYGAGHMPDMEERLVGEFGLKPSEQRWLTAWDMRGGEAPRRGRRSGIRAEGEFTPLPSR